MHTILSSYTAVQYFFPRFELEHVDRKKEREKRKESHRELEKKEKSTVYYTRFLVINSLWTVFSDYWNLIP